ncbi:MAG: Dam family site-specific DNA-(adenine-N6)-methyltransferase [Francisellaceae bacterium]|jgi:DNA adenine methylase|nr:Dam family site-specific DNA-(adenine-N6)-methyltransferase [Francisellaceae bacterium]MBT6539905.1 Dam family site-specific DNA-(adenine-N6)-methyltransferase [Francisellaceae bacterium]
MSEYVRPFLKWPGGKYRVLKHILPHFPSRKILMEPFVGSGAVFLNTDFDNYILGDINPDLINLYKAVQKEGHEFIKYVRKYFTARYNNADKYYSLREKFNLINDPYEKSALFLYLNRHGYNGLCRYNKKAGFYNVPFGTYKRPYFPEYELEFFHQKSQKAKFYCYSFKKLLKKAKSNTLVYADPPYIPLSASASFTQYHKGGFNSSDQEELAQIAQELAQNNVSIILSNHSTEYTKKMYAQSIIHEFYAPRLISCKTRKKVKELIAVFGIP